MAQKLMPERISRIEEDNMSDADKIKLTDRAFGRLKIFLPGYLLIAGASIFVYLQGPSSINNKRRLRDIELNDENVSNFWMVVPYVCGFFLLVATIFIVRFYLQSVHPLRKDIKGRKKSLLFYKPVKSSMGVFNRYYISTPLFQSQQLQINAKDFAEISDNDLLCLEIGPNSNMILGLKNGDKNIHFMQPTL